MTRLSHPLTYAIHILYRLNGEQRSHLGFVLSSFAVLLFIFSSLSLITITPSEVSVCIILEQHMESQKKKIMARVRPQPNKQKQEEEEEKKKSPLFFKKVPPAFVKNFKGTFPTRVCLRSAYVEDPVSWRVKMKQKENGLYITRGWTQIVTDLDLDLGDFLVFKLISEETLRVVAYGLTCCEKKMDIKLKQDREGEANDHCGGGGVEVKSEEEEHEEEDDDDEEEEDEEEERIKTTSGDSEGGRVATVGRARAHPSFSSKKPYPYFDKYLRKYNSLFMTIPATVAREAGQFTKTGAVISGSSGRHWPVGLRLRTNGCRRLDISCGWSRFVGDNGLAHGDTLRLEFRGGKANLIKARVVRRASGPRIIPLRRKSSRNNVLGLLI
ncbi:hypothetical protein CRG98_031167 [Punica granatum]|uniref:TF-B3 domain-containing protein n=1 Tax=Punica granatum TaxID=22663 RepID=A0A2I0IWP0_PUNGR|nr:hypothetical protein CRG98_031167 [Punica granatum]